MIQATGIRPFLLSGSAGMLAQEVVVLHAMGTVALVLGHGRDGIQTARLRIMPQPAEWMVQGQRPQGSSYAEPSGDLSGRRSR